MSRQKSSFLLALAVLVTGGVAGAASYAAYLRTRVPLATFQSGFANPSDLHFLAGGRLLAVSGDGGKNGSEYSSRKLDSVEIWDVETATLVRTLVLPSLSISLYRAYSPAAGVFAYLEDATLTVASARTGDVLWRGDPHVDRPQSKLTGIAFSPDSELVAVARIDGVQLRSTSDGAVVRVLNAPSAEDTFTAEPVFAPNGDVLGAWWGECSALWRVHDGTSRVVTGHVMGFTRRGEPLTNEGISHPNAGFDAVRSPADGKLLRSLFGFKAAASGLIFLRLERQGATTTIEARRVEDDRVLRSVSAGGGAGSEALSPDGDRLAVGLDGGRVEIWSVPP